jgi:hypothetical protein
MLKLNIAMIVALCALALTTGMASANGKLLDPPKKPTLIETLFDKGVAPNLGKKKPIKIGEEPGDLLPQRWQHETAVRTYTENSIEQTFAHSSDTQEFTEGTDSPFTLGTASPNDPQIKTAEPGPAGSTGLTLAP